MSTIIAPNSRPGDHKSVEFVMPVMQAPRRSLTTKSSEINFVAVLTETRATKCINEGFRLLLASAKFVVTGVKPHDVIPPVKLLTELSKVTNLLDGYNDIIVSELFKCKIFNLDNNILEAYLVLLVELARSNSFYHAEVCRLLLQSLVSIETDEAPDEKIAFVHSSFKIMIKELPHFSECLLKQISRALPFMTRPWRNQVHFYRNMLKLADYVPPALSLEVISRLIHKLIDLDCHCPKEEIIAQEEAETQFQMDTVSTTKPPESEEQQSELKHPLGNTFDRVMEVFFEYIESHMKDTDLDESKKTYRTFLTIFDTFIITTYRCLHIQFLMLFITSKRPVFGDHLIDFLWQKVQSPNTEVIFRQISVYYLGSLLCRGRFISVGTLKDSVQLMCRFLHSYVSQSSAAQILTSDVGKHGTFYAVCQSVFYCIAFRHREIVETNDGLEYLQRLNLEQIVTSPLNPLKVISPPVALNFANISRHYQIVYCHAIIEKNQRSALPMAGQGQQQLDVYFPFDPYALLRSKKFVDPIYREYVDHFVAEDEELDDHDEDSDDDDDEMVSSSFKSQSEKLFSYSVSPGFCD